ncbi:MAG TPA: hypothetical protein VGJ49_09460 [Gaiellaceae bacterium]|jgi:hypothetical protein
MRPLATWLVVGSLAVLGLFAVRDAFRGQETAASSPRPERLEKRLHAPPGGATAPPIANHVALREQLESLGVDGVLYVTNADCRRFLLELPSLVWTTPQGLPGPDCTRGTQPVVDQRFGVSAVQVAADAIEARGQGWRLRFQGNDPAFTPSGTLTFLRAGRLFEWTVHCQPGARPTTFEGWRMIKRCPHPVAGAPEQLREVVWLSDSQFAAVAGPERAASLVVVGNGVTTRIFNAVGARLGALSASPRGRYVAARVDENLVVFDLQRRGALAGGSGARAIAWSPDERFWAVAVEDSIAVFSARQPGQSAVTLPLSAFGLEWR